MLIWIITNSMMLLDHHLFYMIGFTHKEVTKEFHKLVTYLREREVNHNYFRKSI